jgi:hypothetical protein
METPIPLKSLAGRGKWRLQREILAGTLGADFFCFGRRENGCQVAAGDSGQGEVAFFGAQEKKCFD